MCALKALPTSTAWVGGPYDVRENTNRSSRNIVGRKSRVEEEIRPWGISRCEYD